MKSILLKIDDELFKELEDSVKNVKVSKTTFIKTAISDAIATVKRKKLANDLKKEIALINDQDLDGALIADFETASLSDLQKYPNED